MISASTKMPYQEVREVSLRSRKIREDESRKKVANLQTNSTVLLGCLVLIALTQTQVKVLPRVDLRIGFTSH